MDAYKQNTDFSDREGNRALLSLYHFRYNSVVFYFNILTKVQSCIQNIWPAYIGYVKYIVFGLDKRFRTSKDDDLHTTLDKSDG